MKSFTYLAAGLGLAMASAATAEDVAFHRGELPAHGTAGVETVAIQIDSETGPLWSGSLTMGPQYGNAHFSQSTNEFASPCPGERSLGAPVNSNNSLNFNISRANWAQEPDKFNITFNWTRSLPACEGQGTDTFGFNRIVEIEHGGSVTIEGAGGATVTVTRAVPA